MLVFKRILSGPSIQITSTEVDPENSANGAEAFLARVQSYAITT